MSEHNEFTSDILSPLVVGSADEVEWAEEADVVIVGFGGAGAAAAIEARDNGASVIALDRFNGGGATAYSGGIVYAGGTKYQKEAGYEDDSDNMYAYLSQEECAVEPDTLKRFCDGSNNDLEWLEANGVPFSGDAFLEKATYPPEGKFLYFSGNEKIPSYKKNAIPAPRGHRAVGEGFTGLVHFQSIRASALQKGSKLLTHAPVRRLIIDKDQTVIGVEIAEIPQSKWAKHDALYNVIVPMKPFANKKYEKAIARCRVFENQFTQRRCIRAKEGVVLSAGGFVFNVEMIRKFKPNIAKVFESFVRLGSMGCDGSGIDLGRSAGGDTDLMDSFFIGRSISPPAAFIKGLLVDKNGRRFLNEDAYTGFLGNAISDLPDGNRAWLILDKPGFKAALKQCLFPGKGMYVYTLPGLLNIFLGGTKKAGSLSKLAKKCGMDLATIEATVRDNNASSKGAQSDSMGKSAENIGPLKQGPYRAINMDLGNKYTATLLFTLGGLRVDESSGAVRSKDGSSIKGLYAAGRTAVGLCSKGYLSGMSIADTVFSGRRAVKAMLHGKKG